MGSVFPTSGTGGAKMSILPVEWGLWGDTQGATTRGLCVPPCSRMGGTAGAKMGGPPDVVEFGEKEEWGVIKWDIPPQQDRRDQNGAAPATVGLWEHGEGERGHLGLFPHLTARSKEGFVKNHPEGMGGHEEGLQERHVVPTQPKRW